MPPPQHHHFNPILNLNSILNLNPILNLNFILILTLNLDPIDLTTIIHDPGLHRRKVCEQMISELKSDIIEAMLNGIEVPTLVY